MSLRRNRSRRGRRAADDDRLDVFDEIIAPLGDSEWRMERRGVLVASAAVLTAAMAIFVLLIPSLSCIFVAFSVAFLVGIALVLVILKRRYRRRQ